MDFKAHIKDVPDFPKKGIIFKDMSPLLRQHFKAVLDGFIGLFPQEYWDEIDVIAGVESRGFTIAAGLAALLGKNIIHIRKAGKLPGKVISKKYSLEYGDDALEMHYGQGNVLIVDDVLATGGTLQAACALCEESGHNLMGIAVLINLKSLNDFSFGALSPQSVVDYA